MAPLVSPTACAGSVLPAGARDLAIEYAAIRQAFGSKLAALGMVQQMIADTEIDLAAGRCLIWHAAWRLDCGERAAQEISIAKTFVAEAVGRVVDRSVQICGARRHFGRHASGELPAGSPTIPDLRRAVGDAPVVDRSPGGPPGRTRPAAGHLTSSTGAAFDGTFQLMAATLCKPLSRPERRTLPCSAGAGLTGFVKQ